MSSDHEQRFGMLANRVNGLRQAVRLDNFRSAQRLRAGLVAYVKDLEGPLREDIAHLYEITAFGCAMWMTATRPSAKSRR